MSDFSYNSLRQRINERIIAANNRGQKVEAFIINRNVWEAEIVKRVMRHFMKNGFLVSTFPTYDENKYVLSVSWEG